MIAAVSENDVIGREGDLPWHLPADLRFFKRKTVGHTLIMGRKTFDTVGKPLPRRRSIVLSRQEDYSPLGVEVVSSLEAALELAGDEEEVFIAGGAWVYREAMAVADRLYITRVHGEVEGDTFFPAIDPSVWNLVEEVRHEANEKHQYPFTFRTYDRWTPRVPS